MNDQEKNEAIAKRLGWGVRRGNNPPKGPFDSDMWSMDGLHWQGCPDYLNDIRAAWEVVEHLSVKYGIQLYRDTTGYAKNEWRMYISTGPIEGPSAYAKTAPRAIAEAFLKLP